MKSMKMNKNITDSKFPKPPKPPDKPLMPYMRYSRKIWEQVKNANPELKLWEVGKIIGQMWRELPEEEKAGFIEEYEQEKVQYNENMKHYHSSPAYQTWLAAKERAEKGLDEPEQYQKPAPVKPPVKPVEDTEDARESYILEDNDDDSDGFLTAKHVSMARYQRNQILMQDIFSSSNLSEYRGYISRHRLQILKRQVDYLISNQMKEDQQVNELQSNHKTKITKIKQDSEKFISEYKKVCESRPNVTETMFVELIDKARSDLINEERNRKLESEKRRLEQERKLEERRLQLERNSVQSTAGINMNVESAGNQSFGQPTTNHQPLVHVVQQNRVPMLQSNQTPVQVVQSGSQPIQIIQTAQGQQAVQIIQSHSEEHSQTNSQQPQILVHQPQNAAPQVIKVPNNQAQYLNQVTIQAPTSAAPPVPSVETPSVQNPPQAMALPVQQMANQPVSSAQIIQGRSQLINVGQSTQIISSPPASQQGNQPIPLTANVTTPQQTASAPAQSSSLMTTAPQAHPPGPIVIHHPPPGHQLLDSGSHQERSIIQPGAAVPPQTEAPSPQGSSTPVATAETKKPPAKKKPVRKPPEQDPNKKPPAKKKKPANPKSKAPTSNDPVPSPGPSTTVSSVGDSSMHQNSPQQSMPPAAPHPSHPGGVPQQVQFQSMPMQQPAYHQTMPPVYQAPMPDMHTPVPNASPPTYPNPQSSMPPAPGPSAQHYPPPGPPHQEPAPMYSPAAAGPPPNFMPHYNPQGVPPHPQAAPMHQNMAPPSQSVSDMQTQPPPPPMQYQQPPNVYPPQQQATYFHPMPPYPVQQHAGVMDNTGGTPHWSYPPPPQPGYPAQSVYMMQPPVQYRTPPPSQTSLPNDQSANTINDTNAAQHSQQQQS